jgi:hypothetical protein
MIKYLGPLQGVIIGLCLIFFRKTVTQILQKAFEKFPKYEDGAKALNMKFEVRSGYIIILGFIFIIVALAGFFKIFTQSP